MGCELDKVVEAINKVASGIRDPRAINQLNELKNDLNKFATSMETSKPVRDFSKLKDVMNNVEIKSIKKNTPEFDKDKKEGPSGTTLVSESTVNSKKKDTIIAPINSQTARSIQGCNK